ncbi:biotin--[acetyl-CoA-carboxylase] ligase [Georgenia sp. TF02-10]|uniref:biotin--[acetyl-CoA-carboxylase] ligase n=1 Tax=Georgenia sp. TF02-10 TaxID=2917725 RepID=UPI001FA7F1ED|nr:biotin--[acetyl-CoA-carboxylase] ligase [Georgenia sp. TF02-10]UNX55699.1 biotin--[acetyl-CoA-carboxylase] ligase [Georgenia sp. TF02-10]
MPAPFSRLVRVARTGSTNADLLAAAAADPGSWPHLSALVADSQEAGRGRTGRPWVTPPGRALTVSVLLRPRVPAAHLPWVTLLTGLAVRRATSDLLGRPTVVKWPNDVLVVDGGEPDLPGWGRDRKVAGILAEAVPAVPPGADDGGAPSEHRADDAARPAVVVGIGVNVAQSPGELPVPWATSLRAAGASVSVDAVLTAVGQHLAVVLDRWEAAAGDAGAAGLTAEVRTACRTIGQVVRVDLPGGGALAGTAVDLDDAGRLLVRRPDGVLGAVAAGDVQHVRPA